MTGSKPGASEPDGRIDIDEEQKKSGSLIREAVRRRVFRTTIGYIVAAWVIVQVVDVVGPAFGIPDVAIRLLVTASLVCLPLVIVLAWTYEFSWSGVRKTVGDSDTGISAHGWFRTGIVAVTAVACLAGVWWVWSSETLSDRNFGEAPDDVFPKTVVVADFKAIVSDEAQWLGEGIANLVRDNLVQSKFLRLVSPRRWQAVIEGSGDDELMSVASDAGIRYLLQGEIIGSRSGYLLTVRLLDTRTGEQLDARTFDAPDVPLALEKATSIAQATRANLKVPIQERVDVYSADFASENPSAYQAFVAALDYWINFDYQDAERMLTGALELQPDFAMARYYLAWVQAVQDRLTDARGNLGEAASSDALNEREQLYIDALAPFLERDMEKAAAGYEALLEQYPYEPEAINLYAEVLTHLRRFDDALAQYQALSQLEPEVQLGWSGVGYIGVLTGQYDVARPAIERFKQLAPDNPNAYVLAGDLGRGEGRLADARQNYIEAIEKGPDLQEAVVSYATVEYLLGNADVALATLDKLINDDSAVPRYRIDAAFAAGGILNGRGQFRKHVEYLDTIDEEIVASEIFVAKALADKALAEMQLTGPTERVAATIDEAIAKSPGVPTRYLFARGLMELAARDVAAVEATAEALRAFALPPDNPDRTEDQAAEYLLGRAALLQQDYTTAVQRFEAALDGAGYRYRLYEAALAQAQLESGEHDAAKGRLETLLREQNPLDPRLDLELDRAFAMLTLARAYRAGGAGGKADELLDVLRQQWADADTGFTGAASVPELRD